MNLVDHFYCVMLDFILLIHMNKSVTLCSLLRDIVCLLVVLRLSGYYLKVFFFCLNPSDALT